MAVLYLVMTILFTWGVIGSAILLIISLTSNKLKIDAKIPCICLIVTMGMSIGSMISYSDEVLKNQQVTIYQRKNQAASAVTKKIDETTKSIETETTTEFITYEYNTIQKETETISSTETIIDSSNDAVSTTDSNTYITTNNNDKDITVYITNTGSKYHSYGCQYLRKSSIQTTLKSALNSGYTPCSKCSPPR